MQIGEGVDKSPINVCDALPWEETESKMKDLSLHPSIGKIWRSIFDKDDHMPLQKTMVTVNVGSPITKGKKNSSPKNSSARIWTPAATNLTSNARQWTT
jgi:hypothetical protein